MLILLQWSSTQNQLQQTLQRNTFGMSVPLRQAMEMKIVSEVSQSFVLLLSRSNTDEDVPLVVPAQPPPSHFYTFFPTTWRFAQPRPRDPAGNGRGPRYFRVHGWRPSDAGDLRCDRGDGAK